MQITLITSEKQAEFLKSYNFLSGDVISATKRDKDFKNGDFWDVVLEFRNYADASLVAQQLFSAGITYGLDLKYSSYDNEPSRVR
jgi:hypothetical protein